MATAQLLAALLFLAAAPTLLPAALARRYGAGALTAALVGAVLPGIAAFLLAYELSGAPGFDARPLLKLAIRIGVPLAAFLGAAFVLHRLEAVPARPRLRVAFFAAAVLCALLDSFVLPDRYPAIHAALLLAAVFLALAGLLLGRMDAARRSWIARLVLVIGAAAFATLHRGLSFDATAARGIHAREDSRAGRSVRYVLRRLGARAIAPPGLASALIPPRRAALLDPAALDARFKDRRAANVLLLTVDTLRADHVGHLGYQRPTTPEWDAHAAGAVVFESAYANYPSSQLSMASLFTGLYPTATGAHRLRDPVNRLTAVPDDPTIAGVLAGLGYETRAETAFNTYYLGGLFRHVPVGFTSFNQDDTSRWVPSSIVADRLVKRLSEAGEGPWFLWGHLFDPHAPYERHEAFHFGDRPRDLYDGEIAAADRELGRVLRAAMARADYGRTIVIIHSDHGEEFLDHGGRYHHSSLFDEQVRVPLTIRVPGFAPRRVAEPVELVDLPATILDLLGSPNAMATQGESLAPFLLPPEELQAEQRPDGAALMMFRESHIVDARLDALRHDALKIIRNRDSGALQLYDLEADPSEAVNLAASRPEDCTRMAARLHGFLAFVEGRSAAAAPPPASDTPPAEDLLRQLPDADPDRKCQLIHGLAMLGPVGAVAAIARELDHPSPRVRETALFGLSILGDASVRPQVAALGSDTSVLKARAWLGDGSLRDELKRRLADEPDRVGLLLALAASGDDGMLGPVAAAVEIGALAASVEPLAMLALGRSGDPRALPALAARFYELRPRPLMVRAMQDVLGRAPPALVAPLWLRLIDHADGEVRGTARARLRSELDAKALDAAEHAMDLLESTRELASDSAYAERRRGDLVAAYETLKGAGIIDWCAAMEEFRSAEARGITAVLAQRVVVDLEALAGGAVLAAVLQRGFDDIGAASLKLGARDARLLPERPLSLLIEFAGAGAALSAGRGGFVLSFGDGPRRVWPLPRFSQVDGGRAVWLAIDPPAPDGSGQMILHLGMEDSAGTLRQEVRDLIPDAR